MFENGATGGIFGRHVRPAEGPSAAQGDIDAKPKPAGFLHGELQRLERRSLLADGHAGREPRMNDERIVLGF